ncbi:hypothetical protein THAOC_20126 [Thalassiosira oceanica]|uniref:Ubiquitin-like domain-containing protein n=1 Tax=Thalassiosira oceanica TaxID=159749 RepID=K0S462_THAOC|nr:hypothetical protein THAOC_20126 [Thalassiosira oceanica]|eukprot:EJK59619.1 hypothetical protein THAOC_20126 [Thalassiosira oceanica]
MGVDYAAVVVPTGNEQSLDDFKHQYESSDWSIAEATCVKRRIREEARLDSEGCYGRTFIFNAEEDGLFLHGLEKKWSDGRRFVFNGDDLEASSTKVSFPLPWGAGTVQLSLTRPEQKFDGKVDIYVKTLSGKIVPLRVRLDDTVDDVKRKFCDKDGTPCDQQRIVAKCRKRGCNYQLEDRHSLSHYGVQRDDTLWMVLRLRGGMYHPSSGRDGTSRIGDERSLGTVKIKYGPGEDELLSIELDEDETCKSLVGKVKERLAAIEELSRELSSVEKRARERIGRRRGTRRQEA